MTHFTGSLIFFSIISYLFIFKYNKNIPLIICPHIMINMLFYLLTLMLGIGFACFLTIFAYSYLTISQITCKRYSRYFQNISLQNFSHKLSIKVIMFQLLNSRRLFVHSFRNLLKLNKYICYTVFSYSIIVTLIGNIIFVSKILVSKLNFSLLTFIVSILFFQKLIIFSTISFGLDKLEELYKPTKLYLELNMKIISNTNNHSKNFIWMLRMNNFIEIIFPKKKNSLLRSPQSVGLQDAVYLCLFQYIHH